MKALLIKLSEEIFKREESELEIARLQKERLDMGSAEAEWQKATAELCSQVRKSEL